MERILISSCLVGEAVRYDGKHRLLQHPLITRWWQEGRLVPFCPEVGGGLGVPRIPAEIQGGTGEEVWRGKANVVNQAGEDVTTAFMLGAERMLAVAKSQGIRIAILTENSPACGVHIIYDGTFQGKKKAGLGVAASLLKQNGIYIFNHTELDAVQELIEKLEKHP